MTGNYIIERKQEEKSREKRGKEEKIGGDREKRA